MQRFNCFLLLTILPIALLSQTEMNSFTSTGSGYATSTINDYQSLGINPANLGFSRNDHSMNIGFFEFGGSIYSEPLTKQEIYSDLYGNPITLDEDGKIEAADAFTNTRMISTASVLLVGFSYLDDEIGGFAFNVRQ